MPSRCDMQIKIGSRGLSVNYYGLQLNQNAELYLICVYPFLETSI